MTKEIIPSFSLKNSQAFTFASILLVFEHFKIQSEIGKE